MSLKKIIIKISRLHRFIFITSLILTGVTSTLKYYFLPSSVTSLIETMSESYGLDITVDDVSADIMDFKISLDDIKWSVRGRYSSPEFFTADHISFDISLVNFVFKGFDLSRSIHEVIIEDALLHIEHKNSNRWNWEDALNGKKIIRYVNQRQKTESRLVNVSTNNPDGTEEELDSGSNFSLASLNFDGLKIVWVEELPADSGGGTIIRSRSELYIDDASLIAKNIIGLFQNNPQPMEIDFDGRTADGVIQASGEINLFSWAESLPQSNENYIPVSNHANRNKLQWVPTFDLDVYIENVGAAALAQMAPDSALTATKGSMTGNLKVSLDIGQILSYATTNLQLAGMEWEVNTGSSVNKGKTLRYAQRGLNNYTNKSMVITASSKGRLGDKDFKVFPSIQTAITREAVSAAPKSVNRIAKSDQYRYEDKEVSPYAIEQSQTEIIRQAQIKRAITAAAEISKRLPLKPNLPISPPKGLPGLPSFGSFGF